MSIKFELCNDLINYLHLIANCKDKNFITYNAIIQRKSKKVVRMLYVLFVQHQCEEE